MSASDIITRGFLEHPPAPLRYGNADAGDPREVAGIMRRLMPSGARVLDVGSGAGVSTKAINADKGNTITCVEPDPDRAVAARALGLDVITEYFDARLAQRLGQVDVVVLGDILEHQFNPMELLSAVRLCLAPDGIVLISVPNVAHWTVRLKLLFGHFDYHDQGIMDATHLRWFTERTLRQLLRHTGFVICHHEKSLGQFLGAYDKIPFKMLTPAIRRKMIELGVLTAPNLFGCQHVVSARIQS